MKKVFWLLLKIGGLVFIVCLAQANSVILKNQAQIIPVADAASVTDSALIFGGGLKPDGPDAIGTGQMSEMQEDRMRQGVELYRAGAVRQLILTGDDGARRQDEVSAMRAFALDQGVPESALTVDPHGYRTAASCERAARVYGVTSTIAVSQSFHLPRIIYLCEFYGIKTIAVSADRRDYNSAWVPYGRETLARLKAWLQVKF